MTFVKDNAMDLMGLALQGFQTGLEERRNKRAFEQQQELMGLQHQNQQALNQQGHNLQMEMWRKTNYPAQVEMLKEAGLNPALMYGMSGGGGTTTGSQGGGSAASGTAPNQPGSKMESVMMGMQMKLMEAQANKLNAEADNERGGVKENLKQDIENKLQDIETKRINNEINKETADYQKRQIRDAAIGEAIKNELNRRNIELKGEQIREIENKIQQKWVQIGLNSLEEIGSLVDKYVPFM
jgi:hypothetical protein